MSLRFLQNSSWKYYYNHTFKAYQLFAECSYLSQRYKEYNDSICILLEKSQTKLEKATIYLKQSILLTQNRFELAI